MTTHPGLLRRWRASVRGYWVMFADATPSLLSRPGHTLGMISGITVAVASALAAVVIADTQQAQVDLRFDLQRSDRVVIKANSPSAAGFSRDAVAAIAGLEPVKAVGEFSIWNQTATVTDSGGGERTGAVQLVADPGGPRASATELVH